MREPTSSESVSAAGCVAGAHVARHAPVTRDVARDHALPGAGVIPMRGQGQLDTADPDRGDAVRQFLCILGL